MSRADDLAALTDRVLVDSLPAGLKAAIDGLLARGLLKDAVLLRVEEMLDRTGQCVPLLRQAVRAHLDTAKGDGP